MMILARFSSFLARLGFKAQPNLVRSTTPTTGTEPQKPLPCFQGVQSPGRVDSQPEGRCGTHRSGMPKMKLPEGGLPNDRL
eukprot:3611220-Rhodomonas_salina.1